jgi:biotin transport system substrate-specific component
MILGSRWGFTSVGVWVLLGLFGLPVFAQGKAGVAILFGPTGGFLIGFMLCAFIVGWLTKLTGTNFLKTVVSMLVGLIVAYAAGLLGLMVHFAYFQNKAIGFEPALALAVLPFLPYDILKTILAAYIGVKARRSLSRAGFMPER